LELNVSKFFDHESAATSFDLFYKSREGLFLIEKLRLAINALLLMGAIKRERIAVLQPNKTYSLIQTGFNLLSSI
jgi:hypothetical protein